MVEYGGREGEIRAVPVVHPVHGPVGARLGDPEAVGDVDAGHGPEGVDDGPGRAPRALVRAVRLPEAVEAHAREDDEPHPRVVVLARVSLRGLRPVARELLGGLDGRVGGESEADAGALRRVCDRSSFCATIKAAVLPQWGGWGLIWSQALDSDTVPESQSLQNISLFHAYYTQKQYMNFRCQNSNVCVYMG